MLISLSDSERSLAAGNSVLVSFVSRRWPGGRVPGATFDTATRPLTGRCRSAATSDPGWPTMMA